MPDAHDTLHEALVLHDQVRERLRDLGMAVQALSPTNEYSGGVGCNLVVSQGTAWSVEIESTKEFFKPLVEAALLKEKDKEKNMARRLEAARRAMQY